MPANRPADDPSDLITLEENVLKETEHEHLRSQGFIRGHTTTAAWTALVNDARRQSRLPLAPEVKAYLVFMLARTIGLVQVVDHTIGLIYYAREMTDGVMPPAVRQQLADTSLLCAGVFPGLLAHRHVMISRNHLIEIGQSLYHQMWIAGAGDFFQELAKTFMRIVMVLEYIRPKTVIRRARLLDEQFDALALPNDREGLQLLHGVQQFADLHLLPSTTANAQ